MARYYKYIFFILLSATFYSCTNPFAPEKIEGQVNDAFLGDQTTIDGLFHNWRYSYIYKDTTTYSNLLHENFTFTYTNHDKGVDMSWGRQEDIRATSRMFQGTHNLDLIWNQIILSIGDSLGLMRDITRRFSLSVEFSPGDRVNLSGTAELKLKREKPDEDWKILNWRDITNE